MTDAIRELFELLTKKEKSGSDYTGTVTRVDGKTAYVQFDGSDITDTPVALSIGAKAGDSVRVRVADGRAWLVGNDDAPPNDSSEVGYELALTNALIRQLTTEQINGENGWINLLLGTFNYGNKLIWNGKELTLNGKVVTTSGTIGGWTISGDQIYKAIITGGYEYRAIMNAPTSLSGATSAITIAVRTNNGAGTVGAWSYPFSVTYDGTLSATKGKIGPWTLSSSGLSTTFFQLTENGVSEGTLLSFINKQDTTIKTEMCAGLFSLQSNTASGVQFLSCSVIKDSGVKAGLITLGNDSNYAVVNVNGLDGSLYCSGAISENGTLLKDKYLGMVSDGNFYGMQIGNSDSAWVRTTSLGLIPYQAGGASSLGTSGWPFSTIYGKTIYENGTALSSKYLAIRPVSIEFNPPATAGHGGYIDFHFNGSTADCTSRIIESSSGTLSIVGALTTSSTINANYNGAMVRAANPTCGNVYVGLHASANGTVGVYTNGYWNGSALAGSGRWLIYRSTTNNTCVESQLYTHNEGYTTLRPVVGTNAGTNAVGVIVSNSASFGIYGRWAGGATAAMSGRTISCPASDIRLKENVEDSTVDALSVINAIKIRQFDWKDKSRGHWDCGMVVDEMEKDIDPKLCIGGGEDEDGNISYKSVDTFYLQGYEVKAIQELHAEVKSLKAEIAELKNIIAVLMEGKS